MGVGPVYAIPLALKNSGLESSDVDLFEARKLQHNIGWLELMIFVTDQRSICIAMRLRCKKAWVAKARRFTSLLGVWLMITLLFREKAS